MMPGPIEFVKCPSCEAIQRRQALTNENMIGAIHYSDGECKAPLMPEYPDFVKCPACGVLFKIIAAAIVKTKIAGQDSHTKTATEDSNDPFVKYLTVDEYIQAINNGLYNTGKKGSTEWKDDLLSLRIFLWRDLNHRAQGNNGSTLVVTGMKDASAEIKKIYDNNCRQLLFLLNEDSDINRIMQAEIHRNLGEFDNCKSSLDKIKQPEKYKRYISTISVACEAKNTLTVEVK